MAKKAKTGTGLSAAQHYLGEVQNAQGKWVRPGAGLASKTLAMQQKTLGNYFPDVTNTTGGNTPYANLRGERLGTYNQISGQFTLAGGKGRPAAMKKHAATMGGITSDSIAQTSSPLFAENDIAQTSLLGTQGKAYAVGRQGISGTLLGATSKPTMPEAEKKRGGGKRGRKGKRAKGRKH